MSYKTFYFCTFNSDPLDILAQCLRGRCPNRCVFQIVARCPPSVMPNTAPAQFGPCTVRFRLFASYALTL
jgi:hypothetical protein